MNTTSIATESIGLGSRIARALAQRIQRWSEAIDAAPPRHHHRMGSWETIISPSAQAATHLMQVEDTQEP